jgi:putative phage-type endonuclease
MSEQRTDEWLAERCGKLTASRFADAIAKTRTGWGASRANYAAELKVERATGQPYPHFVSRAMEDGTAGEPHARVAYCQEYDVDVIEVGFIPHPHIPMSGCSPDGLIGKSGMIEIKCPLSATHWEFLETDIIPGKYITQMMWQLACTGRQWCDYASFDPRQRLELQLKVRRIERDDKLIDLMEKQAVEFLAEVDESVRRVFAKFKLGLAA